jgi:hypothetical protein
LGLSQMEEVKKDAELTKAIREFWQNIVEVVSPDELVDFVQVFRLSRPKQVSDATKDRVGYLYAKLLFRLRPASPSEQYSANLEAAMIKFFKMQKWDVLTSTAPKSQKEKKVFQLLRNRDKNNA